MDRPVEDGPDLGAQGDPAAWEALHARARVAAEYRVTGSPHEWTDEDSLAMARFILAGPAHPAPAASLPAVGREGIARALTPFVQHTTATMLGDQSARNGFDAIDWRRKDEVVASLLALLSDPSETQTGQGDGWLPIETAPKDGTHILVGRPDAKPIRAWFERDRWWMHGCGPLTSHAADLTGPYAPIHWQPLPLPPSPAPETRDDTRNGGVS